MNRDTSLALDEQEQEQEQEQPTEHVEQPAPAGETPAEAFKRLARARMNNALDKIRLIGNLSGSGYEYTPEQVEKMKQSLIEGIAVAFNRFDKKSKKPEFDFD